MTRSCGRGLTGKASQDLRGPLDLLEHLPPNQNLPVLQLSPTPLILTGGYPRPPFSEGNQLRALVNKSPGYNGCVPIQIPWIAF